MYIKRGIMAAPNSVPRDTPAKGVHSEGTSTCGYNGFAKWRMECFHREYFFFFQAVPAQFSLENISHQNRCC